jgi:hypothetical protein
MTLEEFNKLDKSIISDSLFDCCGSEKWTTMMLNEFPFHSEKDLIKKAYNGLV